MIDWTDPEVRARYLPAAKDPTPEEMANDAQEAWYAQERLKAALGDYRPARWRLAEACWECRDVHVWLNIQRQPRISKKEWLADPEISMNERTFDYYAKAWDLVRLSPLGNDSRYQQRLCCLAMSRVVMILRGWMRVGVTLEQAMNEAETWHWTSLHDKYVKGVRDENLDPPPPDPDAPDEEVSLDSSYEDHMNGLADALEGWKDARDRGVQLRDDTIALLDVELRVGEMLVERHPEEAEQVRRQLIAERQLIDSAFE